jgi:protein-disulfide isomerase
LGAGAAHRMMDGRIGSRGREREHPVGNKSKPKPSSSSKSAREKAAAARAAAEAAEKRRQRTVNIAIAAVVLIVVGGIIGGALYFSNQTRQESGAVADPSAPIPTGGFPAGEELAYGIPYGSDPEATTLEVWEDFQCPACGAFEAAAGPNLRQLADDGQILLVTRVTTFLDRSLATDHSRRAAAAYGCAVDAGEGEAYKSTVFANQPEREGDGWTDEQLIGYAEQVGIAGDDLATFDQCLTDRVYLPWTTNSTEEFYNNGIGGTPSVFLDGQPVENADVVDPAKLQELIDQAAQ